MPGATTPARLPPLQPVHVPPPPRTTQPEISGPRRPGGGTWNGTTGPGGRVETRPIPTRADASRQGAYPHGLRQGWTTSDAPRRWVSVHRPTARVEPGPEGPPRERRHPPLGALRTRGVAWVRAAVGTAGALRPAHPPRHLGRGHRAGSARPRDAGPR